MSSKLKKWKFDFYFEGVSLQCLFFCRNFVKKNLKIKFYQIFWCSRFWLWFWLQFAQRGTMCISMHTMFVFEDFILMCSRAGMMIILFRALYAISPTWCSRLLILGFDAQKKNHRIRSPRFPSGRTLHTRCTFTMYTTTNMTHTMLLMFEKNNFALTLGLVYKLGITEGLDSFFKCFGYSNIRCRYL